MTTILGLVLLLIGGSTRAGMFDDAADAMLFNSFSSVKAVDSFALATTSSGVVTLKIDRVTGRYHVEGFLGLSSEPLTSKVCGDVLVARSFSNIVYLVDLSGLPTTSLLARIDLGHDFYDMTYRDGRLFVAAGFAGLKQYRFGDDDSPVLVDSSLSGVHCVQVDVYGDQLLLLDDYNGILRYDLGDGLLGAADEYLLIPRMARSFQRADDHLAIILRYRNVVYWADARPGDMALLDSIGTTVIAEECYVADTLLALVDAPDHIMEVRSLVGGAKTLATMPSSTPVELDADVVFDENIVYLLYPSVSDGLARYNLTDFWFDTQPTEAYAYPGPVTALDSHESLLLTGGVSNPFEVYTLDETSHAVLQTDFDGLDHAALLCDGGPYTFAYFSGIKRFVIMKVNADSVSSVTQFAANRAPRKMHYFDYPQVDSLGLLAVAGGKTIDIYGITSDGRVKQGTNLPPQTLGSILDFTVVDSFLVVTTVDRQLYWFRLLGGLNAILWGSTSTTEAIDHIVMTGPRSSFGDYALPGMCLAFAGNDMYEVTILYAHPAFVNHIATLPVPVVNSARSPDELFTVGPMGLGRLDLRYPTPQMVDFGGFAGNMVAYADNTVAVSDSTGILLYHVIPTTTTGTPEISHDRPLPDDYGLVNYPNPFNPSTRIAFSLPHASEVELTIMNVVGQRVVTLLDDYLSAGNHDVTWNGNDSGGNRVASGVYFYRLSTTEGTATRKMILLR